MTFLVGFPLLTLCVLLQSSVLSSWRFLGGTLDLTLLVVLSWTLAGEWQGGVWWGLMGGTLFDLFSGGPFGAATLGFTLVAYLASLTEGQFWRSHILLPVVTGLLGTLGFHLIYLGAMAANGYVVNWLADLTRITLPTIFINTIFILPVYYGMRRIHQLAYPPQVR